MNAAVIGNVTLDVICYPVDEVPRHESIAFEKSAVSPGGCGSNTAIGLASSGKKTYLVAAMGEDDTAKLLRECWNRVGVMTDFVHTAQGVTTGVSVGLVDSEYQPRFVHTTGANIELTPDVIDILALKTACVTHLHVAGYFVLPGLLDDAFPGVLREAQESGMKTSLDVVTSPRMDNPTPLWGCLPYLDTFMCNKHEGARITGEQSIDAITGSLRERGANNVVIKLGADGCYVSGDSFTGRVIAPVVDVVDTTGAGDAFAAGFINASLQELSLETCCLSGNKAGAYVATKMGAVTAWLEN